MKIWYKIIKNIHQQGLAKTIKIIYLTPRRWLVNNKKIKYYLLRKYIHQHNLSYGKISKLAKALNNGVHPKHEILKYANFFKDRIEASDRILDAGCGSGLVAYEVANKAREVIGIDIERANIQAAQNNYQKENLKFIVGDITKYRFEHKFDKIILSNVLEHIERRVEFLKKLHPISGLILLRVPLLTRDWITVYKKNMGFEYRLDKTHYIEYTLEGLKNELKNAGWRLESYQINWGELWGVVKI